MAHSIASSPDHSTLPPPPATISKLVWFQRPIAIGLMMLFIAPFGFLLVLAQPRWSTARKLVILAVFGPFCLLNSIIFLNNVIANSASTTPARPAVTSHR